VFYPKQITVNYVDVVEEQVGVRVGRDLTLAVKTQEPFGGQ
jgi:hypothetical protein